MKTLEDRRGEAYESGRAAFVAGKPESANPFRDELIERRAWERGWCSRKVEDDDRQDFSDDAFKLSRGHCPSFMDDGDGLPGVNYHAKRRRV